MSKPTDRITPLLFDRELSAEELAYWMKKEPWLFCDHEPVNSDSDKDEDRETRHKELS